MPMRDINKPFNSFEEAFYWVGEQLDKQQQERRERDPEYVCAQDIKLVFAGKEPLLTKVKYTTEDSPVFQTVEIGLEATLGNQVVRHSIRLSKMMYCQNNLRWEAQHMLLKKMLPDMVKYHGTVGYNR